jgi:hypothetical protein
MSKDLRNPFISNNQQVLDEAYSECLKDLELCTPIKLLPLFNFVKSLGLHVKSQMKHRLDTFYVVYILSAGLIDDLPDLLSSIDP